MKLEHDEPPSNFAFKFSSRRYTKQPAPVLDVEGGDPDYNEGSGIGGPPQVRGGGPFTAPGSASGSGSGGGAGGGDWDEMVSGLTGGMITSPGVGMDMESSPGGGVDMDSGPGGGMDVDSGPVGGGMDGGDEGRPVAINGAAGLSAFLEGISLLMSAENRPDDGQAVRPARHSSPRRQMIHDTSAWSVKVTHRSLRCYQ